VPLGITMTSLFHHYDITMTSRSQVELADVPLRRLMLEGVFAQWANAVKAGAWRWHGEHWPSSEVAPAISWTAVAGVTGRAVRSPRLRCDWRCVDSTLTLQICTPTLR
jgi:hypothetical protein